MRLHIGDTATFTVSDEPGKLTGRLIRIDHKDSIQPYEFEMENGDTHWPYQNNIEAASVSDTARMEAKLDRIIQFFGIPE